MRWRTSAKTARIVERALRFDSVQIASPCSGLVNYIFVIAYLVTFTHNISCTFTEDVQVQGMESPASSPRQ